MQAFFLKFPKLLYNNIILTNLAIRFGDSSYFSWLNNDKVYYSYDYQDFDTPEIIASKYYGDPTYHWIILFTNKIVNPNFDLPMNSSTFIKYLNDKYSEDASAHNMNGYDYARYTVDPDMGYQKIVTKIDVRSSDILSKEIIIIDEETWNNLGDSQTTIGMPDGSLVTYKEEKLYPLYTIFDKESSLNEEKRTIKILKKEYVTQITQTLTSYMGSLNG